MNRSSNSMMYRTNGTAALKPQACSFTVHEGTRRDRAQEPERETLTFLQKLECALIIASVIAALGLMLHFIDARAASRFEDSLSAYPTTTITVHTGDFQPSSWQGRSSSSQPADSRLHTPPLVCYRADAC